MVGKHYAVLVTLYPIKVAEGIYNDWGSKTMRNRYDPNENMASAE